MTRDKRAEVRFGGVPLHERLAPQVPSLTAAVVERLVEEIPVYARLPREELAGDIARIVERAIRAFLEVLRTGAPPGPQYQELVRESAVRRAEEGLPAEAVVGAYFLGARACLDRVTPLAEPADLAAVLTSEQLLLDYLRLVTATVTAGYLQGRRAALGEEHAARQALTAALLAGEPAEAAADRAGLDLPAGYLVLDVVVGPHPDESAAGVESSVAARRKLRRLRLELERRAGDGALTALSGDGGVALLPIGEPVRQCGDGQWERIVADLLQLGRICGVELTTGAVRAAVAEVPQAARTAAEVRAVAQAAGLGPGVYRLADVLVEYQLTRPGPARDQLAALLDPLAAHPELLDTLRAFTVGGLDRRRAAALLQVHPNTVDYRLRKVAALTGLDAARGHDHLTLHAALTALTAPPGPGADGRGAAPAAAPPTGPRR
ncbi:PucR family transcriptional regulator [Streptomyces sp. NPDC059740]|uniref:PucR family transcriptional regulator n=1 Tax=Streptomyces sp. NPDC059740 TaxID=3346926 RepID=UPI003658C3F5